MLVEIITVNNTEIVDLDFATDGKIYEKSFDMKIGDDLVFADIADEVYANPLVDEYDQWVQDNVEEYLDQVYMSYCIYENNEV